MGVYLDGEMGITSKVKKAMFDVCRNFIYIGFLLEEAARCEYYREHDYSNIYEYALSELNFKKSSVKNFIAVAREFSVPLADGHPSMQLKSEFSDMRYSQLVEMLSLSKSQRAQIKPAHTVREIRALKSAFVDVSFSEIGQTSGQELVIRFPADLSQMLIDLLETDSMSEIQDFVFSSVRSSVEFYR